MKKETVEVNPNAYVAWCNSGYYGRGEPFCTKIRNVDFRGNTYRQVYVTIDRHPYYKRRCPVAVTIVKKSNKFYFNVYNDRWDPSILAQVLSKISKGSQKQIIE